MTINAREQRRRTLITLMEENELNHQEVANLLHVSISTVEAWLKPATSKSSNPMPPNQLELLWFKLGHEALPQ